MLYQRIDVCRRLPDNAEVVVYRCLRSIPGGGFAVQSADRVRLPFNVKEQSEHDAQFWQLLCEQAPEERSGSFSTLEEAIQAFDAEFGNCWE